MTAKNGDKEQNKGQSESLSLDQLLDCVHDRDSFLLFVAALAEDWETNGVQWENGSISFFLEASVAWSRDWIMHEGKDEGAPGSPNEPMWERMARHYGGSPERPGLKEEASWKTFADFLLAGKFYE